MFLKASPNVDKSSDFQQPGVGVEGSGSSEEPTMMKYARCKTSLMSALATL